MSEPATLLSARAAIRVERFRLAADLLVPLAQRGIAEAAYLLGTLLGDLDAITPEIAYQWLRQAASAGHAEAHLELYRNFVLREAVGLDAEVCRAHLFKAAELGSIDAAHLLGVNFATGDWEGSDGSGPRDDVQAVY